MIVKLVNLTWDIVDLKCAFSLLRGLKDLSLLQDVAEIMTKPTKLIYCLDSSGIIDIPIVEFY